MTNILVTGGCGVVGTKLITELRQRNNFVISCDLHHQADEVGFSIKTDTPMSYYARCDIGEFRQIERIIKELGPFDYVYNCAAEFGRWNGEDFYENLWKTNVIGTKNIIRLQQIYNFRLIHFSSSEVYGDWPELMVETVPDEYAIKQLNDYAMTKWVNEMQMHNAINTESIIIRLFNTYGPGEYYSPYRSVNCRFLYCALHGLPWTVFKGHFRTSTYLDDAIITLANIIDNFKAGEVYNIGGNSLHSIEDMSEIILNITGANKNLVQYRDSETLTTRIKKVDISKAVNDLDHKIRHTLKDGLSITADWMREIYKVR